MNLGDAAQGIGVLNPLLLFPDEQIASLKQFEHQRRANLLPTVWPRLVDLRGKGGYNPLQRLESHRRGDGCGFEQLAGIKQGQRAQSAHVLRAVDQSQALFSRQLDRAQTGLHQSAFRGDDLTLVLHLAKADHGQSHMGQWDKITAGAHRSFSRNHGVNPPVQHTEKKFNHFRAGPRAALGQ